MRVLQATLDDIRRQAGIGYRATAYTPTRTLSGNGTSATGAVGTVTVLTGGTGTATVSVTGVGGAGTATTTEQLANVLATLINDFKGKGTLG